MKTGNTSRLEECLVIEKCAVARGYCRLTLKAPVLVCRACPGQFVMVYMPSCHSHMLPRPLSIFTVDRQKGELSLFFAVKGKGTNILAAAAPGSLLKLLGPLGSGFPALPHRSILAAGGIGIAPLVFLAASTDIPRTMIYGARTADQLACPPADLKLPGLTLIEATEDGSRGEKGIVTELLSSRLSDVNAVFSCGPVAMLKQVVTLANRNKIKAWVSLEEKMACGIGACRGCALLTTDGFRTVCSDGPVFRAGEVNFND